MTTKIWVLRDAITGQPYTEQEDQPDFWDMVVHLTVENSTRECYWALEDITREDNGPPYDAATRTGMYDY